MSRNLPHLAQRLFNVPLAISPMKLEVVVAALADRFGLTHLFRPSGEVILLHEFDLDGEAPARDMPYQVVQGVAVIPITGTLVAKLGSLTPYSGMTGYDGIRANVSMALADESVRAIVLDIESPGGEVSGCMDLSDAVFAARGEKPMWAILSECAYSAAYAIASACDKIIVPRTGGTGSVGVICAHVDFSQALTASGVSVTLITYGARKADGNEFSPLSKDTLARFQADVDAMGEIFVDTVARNRGMSRAKVRATEAGTFMGAAGVQVGFADDVMSPHHGFAKLLQELG